MRTSEFSRKYIHFFVMSVEELITDLVSVSCRKKNGTVHKVLAANKNAHSKMANDRRDEMRIALRAKISQKDYVDKEMKHFHYGKNSATIVNGQMVGNNTTHLQHMQQHQNSLLANGG